MRIVRKTFETIRFLYVEKLLKISFVLVYILFFKAPKKRNFGRVSITNQHPSGTEGKYHNFCVENLRKAFTNNALSQFL